VNLQQDHFWSLQRLVGSFIPPRMLVALSHKPQQKSCRKHSFFLTTLSDGYLGSVIDEGRSKARHVSRLADSRELTIFSMQIAVRRYPVGHALQSVIAHAIHCAFPRHRYAVLLLRAAEPSDLCSGATLWHLFFGIVQRIHPPNARGRATALHLLSSNLCNVRQRAELKHIIKRRKRKQQ
jgi:hypothetical protein